MSHEIETEFGDLAEALREARPTPEREFTDRLDRAVADHFPPEWADEALAGDGRRRTGGPLDRLRRRFRGRRILLPAMAGFAGLMVVATVVVGVMESDRSGVGGDEGNEASELVDRGPVTRKLKKPPTADAVAEQSQAVREALGGGPGRTGSSAFEDSAIPDIGSVNRNAAKPSRDGMRLYDQLGSVDDVASAGKKRDVARAAKITLGTDPDDVQSVANRVVEVTDEHNGIVMDSKVTDGKKGAAGASFRLLIPAGQIEATVADLSGIADLRSRSQELTDITAPTSRAEDDVVDSKAKIESLLGELAETYDEDERAAIEQKIRWERNDLRGAQTRLKRLERRADYTPVSLKVETGGDSSSDNSSWGLSQAVDDAGKLLGVAAGVTLLALAVAIPIGIVVLIALALNRAWVRRSRRRALADDD